MKERPILFSGAMVRAILAGVKTQTRRMVKPQPFGAPSTIKCQTYTQEIIVSGEFSPGKEVFGFWNEDAGWVSPYGQPGDGLWVKETFSANGAFGVDGRKVYRADIPSGKEPGGLKWKPSIFMPRAASRITLEITGVRVERLRDISEADAIAEGGYRDRCACMPRNADRRPMDSLFTQTGCHIHGTEYKALWESINGKGSWANNPWVWVIEFKKL